MANFFAQLPAYRDPGPLDFSGLSEGIDAIGQRNRLDRQEAYQKQRNAIADARAASAESRAARKFSQEQSKEAMSQIAGIYQQIEAAPEADRPMMLRRAQPMFDRLRSMDPEWDMDAKAAGVDPSDYMAIGRLALGRSMGPQDPLERQKTQAEIAETQAKAKYYSERPAGGAAGMGGATGALADRLMAENPGMTLDQAITIARRGNIEAAAASSERGKARGKAWADLPDAKARLSLITGGLDRIEGTAKSLATMPGLGNVVGGLYQAYAPNVTGPALNAQTELENLKVKISGAVLQAMRDASKTGGAVGQVTEREWPRLENMLANLDTRQEKEQFLRNLAQVVTYTQGVKAALREAYEEDARRAQAGGEAPASAEPSGNDGWTDIDGVRIREKR